MTRIRQLGLVRDVDPQILARVLFAIELHSIPDETALQRSASKNGDESMWRVLWVLKDADGLDRVRIADLDSGRLRHADSRDRVAQAWELLAELP